jgi:hypothetical protein
VTRKTSSRLTSLILRPALFLLICWSLVACGQSNTRPQAMNDQERDDLQEMVQHILSVDELRDILHKKGLIEVDWKVANHTFRPLSLSHYADNELFFMANNWKEIRGGPLYHVAYKATPGETKTTHVIYVSMQEESTYRNNGLPLYAVKWIVLF